MKYLILALTLLASISSGLVLAATEADENISAVAAKPAAPSILDQIYVNDFTILHGPNIANVTSSYQADHNGKPSTTAGVNFDNEITTAYLFNQNLGIGPDIPFLWVPVMGQGFILGDLGIKGFERNVISSNGFSLYVGAYLQAPTSVASQARNMTFGAKITPALRYVVPHSRFTLSLWTEEKEYAGVTSGKTFRLYASPAIAYQLSPKFSLNLGYEQDMQHFVGDPGMSFSTYQSDFMPGVIWNVSKQVMLNPYLQAFTTTGWSANTLAVGAMVSATVL